MSNLFFKTVTTPRSTKFSGGDIVKDVEGARLHIFKNSGVLKGPSGKSVEVIVVAGGGGGCVSPWGGGGGGAGGILHHTSYRIKSSNPVMVGAGGASNVRGQDSFFGPLQAMGGGPGDTSQDKSTRAGGCGGGGGHMNPGGAVSLSTQTSNNGGIGYGNGGGNSVYSSPYPTGSGGGAGGAGGNNTSGGVGKIFFSSKYTAYLAGGGGSCDNSPTATAGGFGGGGNGVGNGNGASGVANTGGGGGGSKAGSLGGSGGSGIVIVKYPVSKNVLAYNTTGLVNRYLCDTSFSPSFGGNVTHSGVTFTGEGAYFDAVSSNATFTTSELCTQGTVAFWVKRISDGTQSCIINNQGSGATGKYYNVHFPWSDNNAYFDFGNTSTGGRISFAFNSAWYNVWVHVAMTVGPAGLKVYINGVLYSGNSTASTFTGFDTYPTATLMKNPGTGVRCKGTLRDIRIYNRQLSAAEILDMYTYGI